MFCFGSLASSMLGCSVPVFLVHFATNLAPGYRDSTFFQNCYASDAGEHFEFVQQNYC